MEKLKALNELCKMDTRQSVFPVMDEISKQWRHRTQEETYERISKIQLHKYVPEDIRSHFSASLNLLLTLGIAINLTELPNLWLW